VQYLYFAYAIARRTKSSASSEFGFAASFAVWPIVGLAAAMSVNGHNSEWLASLGLGTLFCHYWLDGRIWKRGAMAPEN
jgi:hypothetical protein